MRGARRGFPGTAAGLVFAVAALLGLCACSSSNAGKAASTPTSIGDATVAGQVADLESALVTAADLPGDFAKVAEVTFGEFDLCGQDVLELAPPSGRLAVAHGNPEENLVLENVLVYADSTAAAAFMDAFAAEAAACESQDAGRAETAKEAAVRVTEAPDVGDRATAVEIEGADSGGRAYTADMVAARTGNVVVVVSSANLGDPPVGKDVVDATLATAVAKVEEAGAP